MAVKEPDPWAAVEIGRSRVGPIGIVLTAAVLLSLTVVLLYAFIQFWPPAPAATTAAVTTSSSRSTISTTEPPGQPGPGITGQVVAEPAVQFFGAALNLSREGRLFMVVLLAGALGGMVHTLRSLYWYVGNRNLRYSWLLMYATLPITGAALALIAYVVLRGELTTTFASSQDISPFGIAAVAALVGLFSRETAEKLKKVFEMLLAPAEKGKDHAVPVRVDRVHPTQRAVGTELTITRTGLAAATAVQFGGVRATPTVVSDTQLRVKVPHEAARGPITVVTPVGMAASTDTFVPGAAEAGQPRIVRFQPTTGKGPGRGRDNRQWLYRSQRGAVRGGEHASDLGVRYRASRAGPARSGHWADHRYGWQHRHHQCDRVHGDLGLRVCRIATLTRHSTDMETFEPQAWPAGAVRQRRRTKQRG